MGLIRLSVLSAVATSCSFGASASASFIDLSNTPDAWFDATGSWETITFTEFPIGTVVTDQYSDLGVTFSGDLNFIGSGFDRDGAGLNGGMVISMEFDSLMHAFSGYHSGFQRMRFFRDGEVLFTSDDLGGSGPEFFSGFVSDIGFDRVDTIGFSANPSDLVFYDDLYFSTIPAPGALVTLAALAVQRRRRG